MKTHNIYLNPERKKYYLQQLDIAKNIKDGYWDLDDGLELILNKINQNSEIQTILSRNPHGSLQEGISYLHLAYSQKIEEKLKFCLLKLESFLIRKQIGEISVGLYNAHEYSSLGIKQKQVNAMLASSPLASWSSKYNEVLSLDAVSNVEKYTNINCFIIMFDGKDDERNHQIFWRKLCNILSKIH